MSGTVRNSSGLALLEITGLHEFLQSWFRGEVGATESVFSRVTDVWGPLFRLIGPDNCARDARELIQTTFGEHGCYPGLSIQIRNLSVREAASGSVVIAHYEERHMDGGISDNRLCSATLLRPDPDIQQVIWLHLHESVFTNSE